MPTIPNSLPNFLWYFVKKHKLSFLGFIFVSVFYASNLSLTPYALKLLIDRVSTTEDASKLFSNTLFPAFLYVGLGCLVGIVFRFYDWLQIKTFPTIKNEITEKMFEYAEKHSYRYFQENLAGGLGNKINDMARSSVVIIGIVFDHFFKQITSIFIGCFVMFFVHPFFSYALILWTVFFIFISFLLSKKAQYYSEVFSESRSNVAGKVIDSLSNILNVKLFAREKFESSYLKNHLNNAAEQNRKGLWYLLKVKVFYASSFTLLMGIMMWLLIYERKNNNITIGDFALILTLNMFLIEEVYSFASQLVPFSEEVGTSRQALSILSKTYEIQDESPPKKLQITKGEIAFKNVCFGYHENKNVFTNLSVSISSGEKIGLVGFSGSGKSTFVNLILRFFEVNSGNISIDNQDIRCVTQESLREQIAMIPQDPLLFHRSLKENIGYGNLLATQDEIVSSSKKAHCHEFIENLPNGYQSLVGERGIKLSGGQRQRIAIARALLKNAPILILDEATSSLDSITENYIQESLDSLIQNKTTIVIAHRLSTLFHLDRILVFNEGKIIEEGKHETLLAMKGHYAQLWNMQSGGFLGDKPKIP